MNDVDAYELVFDALQSKHPHKYSNYIVSLCPFHTDAHPSFFVYKDRYFCKGCSASGTTKHLLNVLTAKPYKPIF